MFVSKLYAAWAISHDKWNMLMTFDCGPLHLASGDMHFPEKGGGANVAPPSKDVSFHGNQKEEICRVDGLVEILIVWC